MKRRKFNSTSKSNKGWDFLLVGDMHIRSDVPLCWDDSFLKEQQTVLEEIHAISTRFAVPIIQSGDVFHRPVISYEWLTRMFELFHPGGDVRPYFYCIPGNHDLPFHNINKFTQSALGLLDYIGTVDASTKPIKKMMGKSDGASVHFFPFGSEIKYVVDQGMYNVAVAHIYVDNVKPRWGGAEHHTTEEVFRMFKGFDLIVTGDNHTPVIDERKGQILINPGSITRQTADQIDHRPRVYLFSVERKEYEAVYLSAGEGMSREHIEGQEKREERISAFVESLSQTHDINLSFEENIKHFIIKNKVPKNIREKIYNAMEIDNYE